MSDVDERELLQAVDALGGLGERVISAVADLSSQAGADKIRAVADEAGWDVDILVHAAGVTGAKGDPLDDITEDDWDHAWQTDFMSAVRVSKAFVPGMRRRGWGRVVFVVSENVAQPYGDEAVYNCAKSALLSLSKSMSMAYGGDGVLVNCCAPAFIKTDMTDGMMAKRAEKLGVSVDEAVESFLEKERPNIVMKRRGRPEEVGFVIACLCSAHASFVTGSNWRVDGGSVQAIDV